MNIKTSLLTALVFTSILAGGYAQAGESLWRVEDRIDIETVPSWFPVALCPATG